MVLYPSQIIPLREAMRVDEYGKFVYSTVVWSSIKKSAKSSIAAAVGMWFAWRKPYSSVKVLGNDLKQAESRVYEYMRRSVMLRPDWRDTVKVNRNKMHFPNGSVIEAIPVDPMGEAGGNDDLVLYTELWGWKSSKHQTMWTESTLSPTKYGESLRWCESYAGYTGESPVLEQLYDSGVKHGELIDAEYEMYRRSDSRLFALWNTQPLLPWQSKDYYQQEAASLTEKEFLRVHRNQWSSPDSQFVPATWWDDCEDRVACEGVHEPVVVGMDAATSGDYFAVVTVSRLRGVVYVKECRVWKPQEQGGRIRFADIEAYLYELRTRYTVREVAYDPYQLYDMAQRLYGKAGYFKAFNQGQDRLIADKQLYDLIRDGRIRHPGDANLTEAIHNANGKADGDKLRLVKRAEHLHIDAAVAGSMAANRAVYYRIGGDA